MKEKDIIKERVMISLVALFFLLFAQIISSSDTMIEIAQENYTISDIVSITINTENVSNYGVFIISDNEVYRYAGLLENTLKFSPKKKGMYLVQAYDIRTDEVRDEVIFSVAKVQKTTIKDTLAGTKTGAETGAETGTQMDVSISTDKKSYMLQEPVDMTLSGDDYTRYKMHIAFGDSVYEFLGALEESMRFIPNTIGVYEIRIVTEEDMIVARTEFEVIQERSDEPPTQEGMEPALVLYETYYGINDTVDILVTGKIGDEHTILIESDNATYRYLDLAERTIHFTPETAGNYSVTLFQDDTVIHHETVFILENITRVPTGQNNISIITMTSFRQIFEVRNNREERLVSDITVRKPDKQIVSDIRPGLPYTVEVVPEKSKVKRIQFNNMKVAKDRKVNLIVSDVHQAKVDVPNKQIVSAFAIDPSLLNFTDANVTAVAQGTELWKCMEWDNQNEICYGTWKKIMDITPGKEYSFGLTPDDPGYAETGIATVNTKKPMYHTYENAEIVMVVLDTYGNLVPSADIILDVKNPDNTTNTYSTHNKDINETEKGIYEVTHDFLYQEGTYLLDIYAEADDVNSTMNSYFLVQDYYEFDIIRDTPVAIDPWQGAINSSIQVLSYTQETRFDVTESVPINFTIEDAGGANVSYVGDTIYLRWYDVNNGSIISYTYSAPLVSPELYALGKAAVTYGSSQEFEEARVWYVAADPAGSVSIVVDAISGTYYPNDDVPIVVTLTCGGGNNRQCDNSNIDYQSCTPAGCTFLNSSDDPYSCGNLDTRSNYICTIGTAADCTTSGAHICSGYRWYAEGSSADDYTINIDATSTNAGTDSGSDIFTVSQAPNEPPTIVNGPSDQGSSHSDPTQEPNNVKFNLSATDDEGDGYKIVVCTTNSTTGTSCTATQLCAGASFVTSGESSCTHATTGESGPYPWFSFVCDDNTDAKCSPGHNGTGTAGSPYYVNNEPTLSSVSANVSYIKNGNDVNVSSSGAADTESDTMKLQCGDSSGVYNLCESTFASGDRDCDFTSAWTDHNVLHTIYCVLNDSFSVSTEYSTSVTSDNRNPSVVPEPATYPSSQTYAKNGDTITLNASVTDSPAGVSSVTIDASVFGCAADLSLTQEGATDFYSNTCVIVSSPADGTHELSITATDNAGNINSSASISVNFDDHSPLVVPEGAKYPSGQTYAKNGDTITLNTSVTDSPAGVSSVTIDASVFGCAAGLTLNQEGATDFYSNTCVIVSSPADGTHELTITATDNAGNVNDSESVSVNFDDTEPEVVPELATYPSSQTYAKNGDTITLNTSVTDTPAGVSSVTIDASVFGCAAGLSLTQEGATDFYSNTCVIVSSPADGTHQLTITATDNAGNVNNTESISVNFDDTDPAVVPEAATYPSSQTYAKNGDTITLNTSVTDSPAGVSSVTIDASTFGCAADLALNQEGATDSYSNTCVIVSSPADGTHELTITATDNAGNVNDSESVSVNFDDTTPSVYDISVNDSDLVVKQAAVLNINVTVVDATAGLFNVTLRNVTLFVLPQVTGTDTYSINKSAADFGCNQVDGVCSLYFNATDNAFNINASEKLLLTIDEKSPAVTSPDTNDTDNIMKSTDSINITVIVTDTNTVSSVTVAGNSMTDAEDVWWSVTTAQTLGCSEGNCTLAFTATDIVGNINDSVNLTITVDDTKPEVVLNYPNDGFNTSLTGIDLNFTVTDNIDTSLSCNITIDGVVNNTDVIVAANGIVTNYTITGYPEGNHTWNVTCWDDIPHINISDTSQFTVDLSSPNIYLEAPANNTLNDTSNTIRFRYNVSDDITAIVNCSLVIDGTIKDTDKTVLEHTSQYIDYTLPNGDYNWSINCTDSVGRVGASETYNLSILIASDTEPPDVTLENPADDYYDNDGTIVFYYTPIDALSGIANCSLIINGTINKTNTTLVTEDAENSFTLTGINEGNYTWTINCTDNSENFNEGEATNGPRNFVVDTTPPTLFTLHTPRNATISSNRTPWFNWTKTSEDYFDNYTIYVDDTLTFASPNYIYAIPSIDTNYYQVISAIGTNTDYYWRVIAYDRAQNNFTAVYYHYTTDTLKPAVALTTPSYGLWTNVSTVTFSYVPTDIHLKNCSLWGNFSGTWKLNQTDTSVTSGVSNSFAAIDLIDGYYLWNVECYDNASNSGWNHTNYTLYIDEEDPSILLINPVELYNTSVRSINFNFSVTDNLDSSMYCNITVDGTVNVSRINALHDTPVNRTVKNFIEGNHTWNVTCFDNATNRNTSVTHAFTVDLSSPNVYLEKPVNNTYWDTSDTVTFEFNTTDDITAVAHCSLIIDGGIVQTNYSIVEDETKVLVHQLSEGLHNWSVNCTDSVGRVGESVVYNISVDPPYFVTPTYPPGETEIDRDDVNPAVTGSLNLTVYLDSEQEGVSVIFYANLTDPELNRKHIELGTMLSNSSGHAVLLFNATDAYNQKLYAGNYTWWAEASNHEIGDVSTFLVYGGLNLTFRYNDTDPMQIYGNVSVRFDEFLKSRGPESDIQINSTYMAGVNVTLVTPNGSNHTVQLYDPDIMPEDTRKIQIESTGTLAHDVNSTILSDSPEQSGSLMIAVNPDKSIYGTGDVAEIFVGVIDETGEPVCDADLSVEVTAPNGKVNRFSTDMKSIQTSAACYKYVQTDVPDYTLRYLVSEGQGRYTITVHADSLNGDSDSYARTFFLVNNSRQFDVRRDAPTRINPIFNYSVTLYITPILEDHTNVRITEPVPYTFNVPESALYDVVKSGDIGDIKEIVWIKNLTKDTETNMSYTFDAPDVFPYMFSTGPLTIDAWQEARTWQIASDAIKISTTPVTVSCAGGTAYDCDPDGSDLTPPGDALTDYLEDDSGAADPTMTINFNNASAVPVNYNVTSANVCFEVDAFTASTCTFTVFNGSEWGAPAQNGCTATGQYCRDVSDIIHSTYQFENAEVRVTVGQPSAANKQWVVDYVVLNGTAEDMAPVIQTFPSDNASSITSPTLEGNNVKFNLTATDPDSTYKILVCTTNATTGTSCAASLICSGATFVASGESYCTYDTTGESGAYPWFAFACDAYSCSSGHNGTGTTGSPYYVNNEPTMAAITANVSYTRQGEYVNIISSGASDTEGNSYKIQCGNKTGTYNLCESQLGTGERNCSFQVPWTGTKNHSLYCILNDSYSRSKENKTWLVVDNGDPRVGLLMPVNDSWDLDGTVTFNYKVIDSYIKNCTLYGNFSGDFLANETDTSIVSGGTESFSAVTLGDGYYLWNVYCYDQSLNNAWNSTNFTVNVDLNDPVVNLTSPDDHDTWTSSSNVLFVYNVTENMTTVDNCSLIINKKINKTNSTAPIPEDETLRFTVNLLDGSYNWSVNCTSASMRVGASLIYNLTVNTTGDQIAPKVLLGDPENNTWWSTDTITFFYTPDDNVGIENCSLIINGKINSTNKTVVNKQENNFSLGNPIQGEFNWTVNCTDSQGNVGENGSEKIIKIDYVAPLVNLTTPKNDSEWNVSEKVEFVFNASDNLANHLANCTLVINSQNYDVHYSIPQDTPHSYTKVMPNGNYHWTVTCHDLAGNLYTAGVYNLTVNSTLKHWNASFQLYIGNDGVWTVNTNAIAQWFYPVSLNSSRNFTVDTVPPNVTLVAPENNSVNKTRDMTFFYNVTDIYSNVSLCQLYIDGSNVSTAFEVTRNLTHDFDHYLDFKNHSWYVRCTDYAGNNGTSGLYYINITYIDFFLNYTYIIFEKSTVVETENITINATITNLGDQDFTGNVTVQFFVGDPEIDGVKLNGNRTIQDLKSGANKTVNVSWIAGVGIYNFYVVVDPPLSTNGSVNEYNESNNKANRSLFVPAYHIYYGNVSLDVTLADQMNNSLIDWVNAINTTGAIFSTDSDSIVTWAQVEAISRNITKNFSFNDFVEIDLALNMTNFTDSINRTFTFNSSLRSNTSFSLLGKQINDTPVINSTNSSYFMTGILWDTSDENPGEYNGSQDLIFITKVNKSKEGKYGKYDYEFRVPAYLRKYKDPTNTVMLYVELI